MTGRAQPAMPRLYANVEVIPFSGCWIWMRSLYPCGYGIVSLNGKPRSAHRVSWEVHNGPIPDGLCVLHRCDVKQCINPTHLFLGTKKDNTADMHEKGRDSNQNKGRTVCHQGHPLNEENTYTRPNGKRRCRLCRAAQEKRRYYELKQEQ